MPALKYCRYSGEWKEKAATLQAGDVCRLPSFPAANSLRNSAVRLGMDIRVRQVPDGYAVHCLGPRRARTRDRRSLRRPHAQAYGTVKAAVGRLLADGVLVVPDVAAADVTRVVAARMGITIRVEQVNFGPQRRITVKSLPSEIRKSAA